MDTPKSAVVGVLEVRAEGRVSSFMPRSASLPYIDHAAAYYISSMLRTCWGCPSMECVVDVLFVLCAATG